MMLSVIMPAYNAANALRQVVDNVSKVLNEHGIKYEIIIVNDGSIDGTYTKALDIQEHSKNIIVVGYSPNRGKGYALKYGFDFSHGDLVMFFDADLDISPDKIPIFLHYMEKNNANVVVGSKWHPLSRVNWPKHRRILSKGYNILIKLLFDLNIRETQVGMKLFERKSLKIVIPSIEADKYVFDVELLVSLQKIGCKIVEAPITIGHHFSSKVKSKDMWNIFLDTIKTYYRIKMSGKTGKKNM